MQKLWLSVSGMTENIVLSSVNPILEQYRPAIFNQVTSIGIHRRVERARKGKGH